MCWGVDGDPALFADDVCLFWCFGGDAGDGDGDFAGRVGEGDGVVEVDFSIGVNATYGGHDGWMGTEGESDVGDGVDGDVVCATTAEGWIEKVGVF